MARMVAAEILGQRYKVLTSHFGRTLVHANYNLLASLTWLMTIMQLLLLEITDVGIGGGCLSLAVTTRMRD